MIVRSSYLAVLLLSAATANAQLSLSTVVDFAVRNSPRVKMAEADVEKARAGVSQAKDVYIPAITIGAGLGNSYGYSTNPPTLFTVTSQSLVYNSAQIDAIRAARASLEAATFSLADAQETVALDAALNFIALQHHQRRGAVLREQADLAARLVSISEERFNAGRDNRLDLTSARLTAAQFRLNRLHTEDDAADARDHLARLIGITPAAVLIEDALPPPPELDLSPDRPSTAQSNAVAAAFAVARSKQELAFGDSRYRYRPQVSLFLQYNRYATFANSFAQLENLYGASSTRIGANEEAYGVQISIPLYDRLHQAKARESAAEAARAFHEAEYARFQFHDGDSRLRHSMLELQARAEVATLDQQYAQLQLDALLVQLNSAPSGGPQMTPKDEQNSRIAEREKYLAVIDATYQMQQVQINILRQTGQLSGWLKSAPQAKTPAPSSAMQSLPVAPEPSLQ